ncbi:hypothetical protein CTAYLR_002779 [Chrysophaeum taylorii]|uniref:Rab-GAP TBC domain-containing protein n=1 Tax=Chrysophaeum taylorii TaxID=2483200 RepID=A0AAD7UE05_9STRA|nr:hypothetical protein CTAYLR_002779 [Chrysophaeum taylorii]
MEATKSAMVASHAVLRAKKAVGDCLLARQGNQEEVSRKKRGKGTEKSLTVSTLRKALEEGGWAKLVRLETYATVRRFERRTREEGELEGVAVARDAWERSVADELAAVESEEPSEPRFLYDSDDLLEVIAKIASPAARRGSLGVVGLHLRMPRLDDLRKTFAELEPSKRQYGVDDVFSAKPGRFADEWHALGRRCLDAGHVPVVRAFATRGVPPALRPTLWRVLLGLPAVGGRAEQDYYAVLSQATEKKQVTDHLHEMDVQRVADTDYYFPFEEALKHVVLAFSRDDNWIVDNCGGDLPRPHRGFVSYAAPLTFLYDAEEPLYFALRAMYARYWARLNLISSKPDTLVPLCKLFEQLLVDHHPRLFFHLVKIGIAPLAIALPWIHFAFVSLLDVDQVLLVWDRILGFDTLTVLPVLAAAIFLYRSEQLLEATTVGDVKDMFSDCSMLAAIPLLQCALSVAHDLVVVVVVVVLRPSDRQSERAIRIMRCVLRGIFGTTTTLALQAWTTTTTTRLATRRHSTFLEQAEAWGGAYRAEVKEAALITQCAVRLCMDVEESLSVARSEAASVGTGVSTTVSGTAAVKGDSTPVTAADFGIQGFISASLQRAFPSDLFMGEEDASALRSDDALREKSHDMAARMARERGFDLDQTTFLDAVDRGRLELSPGKRVWILDPIDGTKGLVTGQEYAIGLALVVDGDPVVGVLANPNRPVVPIMVAVKGAGIRFWPYAGFGYMQDEYQPPWQRQSYDYSKLAPDAKGSWGELGSAPATPAVDYPPFLVSRPVDAASPLPFGPMAAPSELCCGALVKYFAVASGEAAAFIMFEANLKSWDHAPGVLCVLESGGTCVDARNQPIKFYDRAFAVDGAIVAFAKAADTKTRQLVTASVLDALRATSSSSSAPSD